MFLWYKLLLLSVALLRVTVLHRLGVGAGMGMLGGTVPVAGTVGRVVVVLGAVFLIPA